MGMSKGGSRVDCPFTLEARGEKRETRNEKPETRTRACVGLLIIWIRTIHCSQFTTHYSLLTVH